MKAFQATIIMVALTATTAEGQSLVEINDKLVLVDPATPTQETASFNLISFQYINNVRFKCEHQF